ncbi:MAG: nucleotide sugar dehydrogenase [Acidiferrobacterales bacterium]
MKYKSFSDVAATIGRHAPPPQRPIVCVQGLGFVGAAMAIAVANARDSSGSPHFNVIGVDLPTCGGLAKIEAINSGTFPFRHNDPNLASALRDAHSAGNLIATSDPEVYSVASTVTVDVPLDVKFDRGGARLKLDEFREAVRVVGKFIQPGCLLIIETTVPPGTCEKVIAPELAATLKGRGLPEDGFLLAHSYERVMPGKGYFDSIVNYWRVYAGLTPAAANACEAFLSKVIDVKNYPLSRMVSITASETGKVLENSYRATTIAFIEEWSQFAESIGIDLFEVIHAIQKRPTHSNMRLPGFGVGGYCLTKDPLLAALGTRELFGLEEIRFPFCELALAVNRAMPLVSLDKVQKMLGDSLQEKSVFLLGVSYRPEIGDTRYSPSQLFVTEARARGAQVTCFDPFVDYWPELDEQLPAELPTHLDVDAVVFAVAHEEFKTLNVKTWLNGSRPVVLDANNVLGKEQRRAFRAAGCKLASIGRGEGL